MSNRWRWVSAVVVGCALLVSPPNLAMAQSGADDGWTVPLTPWGEPDLQGVWTSATLTPLERPARQAGRELLTDEEAAALEQQSAASRAASDGRSAPGSVGGYNQVWLDAGTRITGSRRTSLIVDPPDGRIPWRPGEREAHDRERARYGVGPFHSYTDADTGERCITDGLPNMVPLQPYNMNLQVLQTPGQVVMLHEMYHELRVIPLDDRPLTGIAQWTGRGAGPVGGRHPCRRDRQPRRQARRLLELSVAQVALHPAAGRAVHAGRSGVDRLHVHPGGPGGLHAGVDGFGSHDHRSGLARRDGGAAVGVRLPRGQPRDDQRPERRPGGRGAGGAGAVAGRTRSPPHAGEAGAAQPRWTCRTPRQGDGGRRRRPTRHGRSSRWRAEPGRSGSVRRDDSRAALRPCAQVPQRRRTPGRAAILRSSVRTLRSARV